MINILFSLSYAKPADARAPGPFTDTFCQLLPSYSHVSSCIVPGVSPNPPYKIVFFLASSYTITNDCLPPGPAPSNFFHAFPSHSQVSLFTFLIPGLPPNTINLSR